MLFGLDALTVVLDPERARVLAGGSYDLTNRVDHEPGLLLVYVMAAVRVCNVAGAWHLAHKVGPVPPCAG
jgi:hypothetical protein